MDRLAKQQACQPFIEQEIEKGLAEGKTKYAIGQEITDWLKKFLLLEYKPKTIAKRAERIATNVATEPTTEDDSEKEEIQAKTAVTPEEDLGKEKIQVEPTHGGVREGLGGRPSINHPRDRKGLSKQASRGGEGGPVRAILIFQG